MRLKIADLEKSADSLVRDFVEALRRESATLAVHRVCDYGNVAELHTEHTKDKDR